MDLPYTKLPLTKNVEIRNDSIIGEADFSRSTDPFKIYAENWVKAPHLVFAKLAAQPESMLSFVKMWGVLNYSTIERDQYLLPTIISLSHPLHRNIKLLKTARFSIDLKQLYREHSRLRALLTLWKAFRDTEPAGVKKALDGWIAANNCSLEKLVSQPIVLPLKHRAAPKSVMDLKYEDAMICAQAAMARSFGMNLAGLFSSHPPFICFEAVFDTDPLSQAKDLEGSRMHYHVMDMLSAMWWMIFADVTRGLSQRDCMNDCGRVFVPKRSNQRFCSPRCRDQHRSRKYYWEKSG
jgi:hypothetical protein